MDLAQLSKLQPPKLSQSVHREECTQCFDNQDGPLGIDVCLTCFNGGCLDPDRHHALTHYKKTGHKFALNVKRRRKPSSRRGEGEEPPTKMTKLAIVEEREEDKYAHTIVLKSYEDGLEHPELSADPLVQSLSDGVLKSLSSGRQSEISSWEEETTICEHTLTLEQLATGPIPASGLAHCSRCELKDNLWLCLTCGSLGCGRKQYGGAPGGNGHGLNHFEETAHPVSVKLGTITPEGGADIYCYVCNDSKLDPELALHLSTFGINVQTQTKTEKSMTELQIEHNLKYDFSLTDEDGKALEPVFGPGLTGLSNLGNSCYMASVVQTLFSLPSFQNTYYPSASEHWEKCTEPLPAECVPCQMHKLADGVLSGRYSIPSATREHPPLSHDSPTPVFQDGVRPMGFKALIGKGHEEFSTMKQQDSEEFFTHLLKVLRRTLQRAQDAGELDPTKVFTFAMEQRLQCTSCHRVRYRNDELDVVSVAVPAIEESKDAEGKVAYRDVLLTDLLDILTGDEGLEYTCPQCDKAVVAHKRSRFATFPDVLVIHAKKFQLVNWVPTKLDIPINLPPSDALSLNKYIGKGLQATEVELPDDKAESSGLPAFNAEAMDQLEGMGFPTVRCQKALLATGNADPTVAMDWLFAHMDDPGIDDPIPVGGGSSKGPEPSSEQIAMLSDMGFTPAQARKALRETGGDAERAVEWLFNHPEDTGEDVPMGDASEGPSSKTKELPGSGALPANYRLKAFISHKGPSVHSGHYVVHIKNPGLGPQPSTSDVGEEAEEGWVLFNDEKVVKADRESVRDLKRLAYLYIFEKV